MKLTILYKTSLPKEVKIKVKMKMIEHQLGMFLIDMIEVVQ